MQIDNHGSRVLDVYWHGILTKTKVILKLTQRSLDEHTLIQLLHIRRDAKCRHSIEHTERVAPLQKFMGVSFM